MSSVEYKKELFKTSTHWTFQKAIKLNVKIFCSRYQDFNLMRSHLWFSIKSFKNLQKIHRSFKDLKDFPNKHFEDLLKKMNVDFLENFHIFSKENIFKSKIFIKSFLLKIFWRKSAKIYRRMKDLHKRSSWDLIICEI